VYLRYQTFPRSQPCTRPIENEFSDLFRLPLELLFDHRNYLSGEFSQYKALQMGISGPFQFLQVIAVKAITNTSQAN
jgi:hypothetical protein